MQANLGIYAITVPLALWLEKCKPTTFIVEQYALIIRNIHMNTPIFLQKKVGFLVG
jgi:hypothetical protein